MKFSQLKLDGSKTFAMCYAGHQFGHFVPRLGDGRAINLGKINGQHGLGIKTSRALALIDNDKYSNYSS